MALLLIGLLLQFLHLVPGAGSTGINLVPTRDIRIRVGIVGASTACAACATSIAFAPALQIFAVAIFHAIIRTGTGTAGRAAIAVGLLARVFYRYIIHAIGMCRFLHGLRFHCQCNRSEEHTSELQSLMRI